MGLGLGMTSLNYVSLLARDTPAFLTAITDLEMRESATGEWVLYATSRSGGEISAFVVDPGGQTSLRDSQAVATDTSSLAFISMGATAYALSLSPQSQTSRLYALDESGRMVGGAQSLPTFANTMDGLVQIDIGGSTYLYCSDMDSGGLEAFRMDSSGGLSAVSLGATTMEASGIAYAPAANTDFLLTANTPGTQLQSYQVLPDGTLIERGTCGADQGLGVAGISAFDHVTLCDGTYVIVAARDSSSLSVLRMGTDGSLSATDHVIDDLGTRFQNVTSLDTVTYGERVFVLAGGADDGLTMFELLPGGRLLCHATITDSFGMSLADVSAIATTAQGNELQVFVGSGTETGVTQLSATMERSGQTQYGGTGHDTLTGTADSEVMSGGAGNDRLLGNGGDDILVDGAGRDTMFGGAGTDVFVLEADGTRDDIRDFTAGIDQLDLTGWPMLRNLDQVDFTTLWNGAMLSFGSEELRLYSDDGLPLSRRDVLTSDVIGLTRVPAAPLEAVVPDIEFTGTAGADRLDGNANNNLMFGLEGNDTLLGLDGADTLDGGAGQDFLDGGVGDDCFGGRWRQ